MLNRTYLERNVSDCLREREWYIRVYRDKCNVRLRRKNSYCCDEGVKSIAMRPESVSLVMIETAAETDLLSAQQARIVSLQDKVIDLRRKRHRDRILLQAKFDECERLQSMSREVQRLAHAEGQHADRASHLEQLLQESNYNLVLADERAKQDRHRTEQLEQQLQAFAQEAAAQSDRHRQELTTVQAQVQSLDETRQAYQQLQNEIETQTAQFQNMEKQMHQQLCSMRQQVRTR